MRNAQQLQSGLGNVKNSEDVIQGILVIVIGEIDTTYLGLGLLKTTCLTQLAWWMDPSSGFKLPLACHLIYLSLCLCFPLLECQASDPFGGKCMLTCVQSLRQHCCWESEVI